MSESPKNLYEKQFDYGNNRKNLGFDYHEEDIIVKKTMMPRLFENENKLKKTFNTIKSNNHFIEPN